MLQLRPVFLPKLLVRAVSKRTMLVVVLLLPAQVQHLQQPKLWQWPVQERVVLRHIERLPLLDLRELQHWQVQERRLLRHIQHGVLHLLQHQLRKREISRRVVLRDQQRLLVRGVRHLRDRQVQERRVLRHVQHGVLGPHVVLLGKVSFGPLLHVRGHVLHLLQHQLRKREISRRVVLRDQQRLLVRGVRRVRDRQVHDRRVLRHV